MGIKLINEVMDHAGKLTPSEWKALVVLAEDANDETRLTWSPVTGEKITDRIGLEPHAWTNLRGRLVGKGLLEVAEAGRRGRCAKYRFADGLVSNAGREGVTDSLSPQSEDETGLMRPRSEDANPEYVLSLVTPTPHYSSEEQAPSEPAIAEAADTSSASHEKPAPIGEVDAAASALKTGSLTQKTAKIPTQRKPYPSNRQRDNNWRAQIAAADVDELYSAARSLSVGENRYLSACKLAAYRLGLGADIDPDEDIPANLWPQFVRHMYLYLLKDLAATDETHLDEAKCALDETITAGKQPPKWDETMWTPDGETTASFGARMKQVARGMTPAQVGPWAGEFEDFRSQIWYDARQHAREQLRKQRMPLEIETIGVQAMQFVIDHYAGTGGGKWPMEVVPPPMRPAFPAQSAPPAWAA